MIFSFEKDFFVLNDFLVLVLKTKQVYIIILEG